MSFSKFLPADFDSLSPIMLIAGRGIYPVMVAEKIRSLGLNLKLIAFEDETREDLFASFAPENKVKINVGQLGKFVKSAKNFGAKYAIMAGQITPKKLFKGLKPDLKAMIILAKLKEKNAETIFGAVGEELANVGCTLLDARAFLDDCLAPKGFFSGKAWSVLPEHLEHGLKIARECASLDIGQGCVVARGSVVAVEAFEGTDKMLVRAGEFHAKDALFVKTVKRRQDYRFDVPVIGERTILKLAEAQILNVALESEKVIILEPKKVKAMAEERGIKIFGV